MARHPTRQHSLLNFPATRLQDNCHSKFSSNMFWNCTTIYELPHDKTSKMTVLPAKTQISLGISPVWSVFAVHVKKAWVLSYPLSAQRRLWSDWADAQADHSLRWAHSHFVGFVMRWLNYLYHEDSFIFSMLICSRHKGDTFQFFLFNKTVCTFINRLFQSLKEFKIILTVKISINKIALCHSAENMNN